MKILNVHLTLSKHTLNVSSSSCKQFYWFGDVVIFVGVLGQKRRILWTKPGDLRVLKTEGIKRLELPRVVGMKVVGFWA